MVALYSHNLSVKIYSMTLPALLSSRAVVIPLVTRWKHLESCQLAKHSVSFQSCTYCQFSNRDATLTHVVTSTR